MEEYGFDAFISYSHRDMKWGRWLQKKLEGFHLPREAAEKRQREQGEGKGPGGAKLKIFRDQTDLAGAELQASLNRELERSRFLIVICSPASAASRWVNAEILHFMSLGRADRIIPFIVDGEPFSENPELECFAPALREKEGDDLLGVNIQEIGKNKAFLKTVSVLLDVRFNRLVDRAKQRRLRVGLSVGAVALVIGAVVGTLLWQNTKVREKNKALNYDIYGAAIYSLSMKNDLTEDEIAFVQASAEEGNADAMRILSEIYKNGWGMEKDEEKAFQWLLRSAELGHPEAMLGVGHLYINGQGTEQNYELAAYWYGEAASHGNMDALASLAFCYIDGQGVEKDPQKGFELLQQAAEKDNTLALYGTANCYHLGIGTEQNDSKAMEYQKKLAEKGETFPMINVGSMYQNGIGTEENPREAYKWFRKAAFNGDPDGMRLVGWCTENHYGTENAALEWYLQAAEAGDEKAAKEVERILSQNQEQAQDQEKGLDRNQEQGHDLDQNEKEPEEELSPSGEQETVSP